MWPSFLTPWSHRISCCLLAGLGVLPWAANAVAGEPPPLPDRITINAGQPPRRVAPGCRADLWRVYRDVHQKLWAGGLSALADYLQNHLGTNGGGVSYPPLAQGDVVPLFGRLYRVARLIERGPETATPGDGAIELELVKPAEVSVALAIRPDAFVIPIRSPSGGGGQAGLHQATLEVQSINALAEGGDPVASVRLSIPLGWKNRSVQPGVARARAGDLLPVGDVAHRVRAVVPRDEQTGVIGWLELDPRPVPEAEWPRLAAPVARVVPPRQERIIARALEGRGIKPGECTWVHSFKDDPNLGALPLGVSVEPEYFRWLGRGPFLDYPPLREGDVVPMLGYLYRVGEMSSGPGGSVTLDGLKDEEVPAGAAVDPNSLVIPLHRLGSGGRSRVWDTDVWVHAIEPAPAGERGPVAYLKVGDFRGVPKAYRRGEVVEVGPGQRLGVRAIVPFDPSRQVIGWVEFERVNQP